MNELYGINMVIRSIFRNKVSKRTDCFFCEYEDACLGHIPGAKYACCGHGITDAYIIYDEFNTDFNLAHIKEF